SAILPAWARTSLRMAEVLPLPYLRGLSSSDFGPALEQFLDTGNELSTATVTRLTKDWPGEATAFGQRVTKGPGSRAAGIAMAFKFIKSAQHRWRAVNSAHLVTLVRAGATFENGILVERPDESASGDTHAA